MRLVLVALASIGSVPPLDAEPHACEAVVREWLITYLLVWLIRSGEAIGL